MREQIQSGRGKLRCCAGTWSRFG